MTDDEIWNLERQFWTGHGPFHDRTVGAESVMCFGQPLGVLKGADARQALDDAPDWTGVEMTDRVLSRPTDDVAVTGYTAHGEAEHVIHKVFCSSTWVRRDGDWHQVQHQQTPV